MTTASSNVTGPAEIVPQESDGPVQLIGRVLPDGERFLAVVDGLALEGKGATPDAAQQSLVQAVRGWLERLDTSGKLGAALGLDALDEEAEIILEFIDEQAEAEDPLD